MYYIGVLKVVHRERQNSDLRGVYRFLTVMDAGSLLLSFCDTAIKFRHGLCVIPCLKYQ